MNTPTSDAKQEMPFSELHFPTGDQKDYVQKELDHLQGIIARMGTNSFQCKGWAIGIVTIVLAINKDSFLLSGWQSLILLLPVLIFWYLDGFFLYTEQCYREMFNNVVIKRFYKSLDQPQADWTNLFDYNYTRFENDRVRGKGFLTYHLPIHLINRTIRLFSWVRRDKKKPSKINTIASTMFSKTLVPFYMLPALFVIIASLKSSGFINLTSSKQVAKPIIVQVDSVTLMPILRALHKNERSSHSISLDTLK